MRSAQRDINADLSIGTTLRGESGASWEVAERLGHGGTAVVYGVRAGDGREAAAKLLSGHRFPVDSAMRKRFAREIEHLASIRHPNVLAVVDRATYKGADVLICERMRGSVRDRLRDSGAPPLDEALAWLCLAIAGTQAMHDNALVHRDLSPSNLLLRSDGTLAVGDVGTVRHHDDATITREEGLGSMIYISPQQFEAPHRAAWRDDVYSLGQIGWELVTGKRPQGNTPPARTLIDHVPRVLSDLLERMRAYEPTERPNAIGALTELVGDMARDSEARPLMRRAIWRLGPDSLSAMSHRLKDEPGQRPERKHNAVLRGIAELERALEPVGDGPAGSSVAQLARYEHLEDRGRTGLPEDVDFLMGQLALDDFTTLKVVDYSLGLVQAPQGVRRIDHYLYHGTQRQRNYAALYFKRRNDARRLQHAVGTGAIDRTQAFSA